MKTKFLSREKKTHLAYLTSNFFRRKGGGVMMLLEEYIKLLKRYRKDDTMDNCYNYNLTGEKTLYSVLNEFNRFRLTLHDYYDKQIKSMAKYKGSFGYEKDYKKYLKEYKDKLSKGQADATKDLNYVLSKYSKAVDNYTVEPPTPEQLRILQTLSLKKKCTQEELDEVAQSVKDNPLALSVVTDKAKENGLLHTRYDKLNNKPTKRQLQDELEHIKGISTHFIKTPFSRASELVFEHRKRLGYINENDYDELKTWNELSLQHELDFTDAYSFEKSLKVSPVNMTALQSEM